MADGLAIIVEKVSTIHLHASSPDCRTIILLKVVSKSFDNVAEFKYLGSTLTSQNCSELSSGMMVKAARTSETSVDNYFTRQYIPEDNSELHTRRRENLNLTDQISIHEKI
jgi:hypothetical protein